MKELNFEQMENIQGGACDSIHTTGTGFACGIATVLIFTPAAVIGAAAGLLCLGGGLGYAILC